MNKFGIFFFYEGVYVRSYFLSKEYDLELDAEHALKLFLEQEKAARWHNYLIKPIKNNNDHKMF